MSDMQDSEQVFDDELWTPVLPPPLHTRDFLPRGKKTEEDMQRTRTYVLHIPMPDGGSPLSPQAQRCMDVAREALALFLRRNAGYGNTAYTLGAKGQFADMNRKMGKLHHTLWDGNPSVGESIEEMLEDMIGHCLLTIDFIHHQEETT